MDLGAAYKTFVQWHRIYGDIFRIKLFKDEIVILNDYESIYEMLVSKTLLFANRPYTYRANEVYGAGYPGITFLNYSPQWIFRKKTMVRSLKAYGEGLKVLENISIGFIDKMIRQIKQKSKISPKGIDMKPLLHLCTGGIITSLAYGEELSEAELLGVLEHVDGTLKFISPVGIEPLLDLWPTLRFLPIPAFRDGARHSFAFAQWFKEKYERERNKAPEDIVDCIAKDCSALQKAGKISTEEIVGSFTDVVSGGFITTTISTYTLIGILSSRPDIQNKLFQEIQRVTRGRKPELTDRKNMPYVEAVILELLRYTTIVPLLVPHESTEDTVLGGYDIPKGTIVMANIWGLSHDEKYWDQPFSFVPERFLTSDGGLVDVRHPNRKQLLVFGGGRRSCPGELVAKNRAFLIVTHLVQNFQFKPEEDGDLPDVHPENFETGIVLTPKQFKVRVEERT